MLIDTELQFWIWYKGHPKKKLQNAPFLQFPNIKNKNICFVEISLYIFVQILVNYYDISN